ncbi:MAG: DUF3520 domain-containing protein, partial [Planctomycetaceae bacterium]|nr:DUF3520 domain-containing protein [Planctomycetaceae bacterium]
ENRQLADEDFLDDRRDAGEIGAGHAVTAFYEIIPVLSGDSVPAVPELRYQAGASLTEAADSAELLTLRIRYKDPVSDEVQSITFRGFDDGHEFAQASDDFRFATAVAAFGMLLRDSQFSGHVQWHDIAQWAELSLGADANGHRHEFLTLVMLAQEMAGDDLVVSRDPVPNLRERQAR